MMGERASPPRAALPKISANISTLFRELPMLGRFEAARAAGFDGVEIQFPYQNPATVLADAAVAAGMPVILINGPVLPGSYPLGTACRPEQSHAFRAQLPQIREYAEALKVKFVHILAGTLGPRDDRERCWNVYVENLRFAAGILGEYGVQTLIEPLNPIDAPGYLLNTLADATLAIEQCGSGLGLQFDAYHIARMGSEPAAEFQGVAPLVKHVQFADHPGRHEPGTGRIAFGDFVAALVKFRYGGWLGAEYHPSATTLAGLEWLASWRRSFGRSGP